MSTPFMKQKPKSRPVKGQCTFADFSEGLYLLDTPRGLGEQLGSLAMTGGRNVFTEKGSLVPQFGYDIKGKLPDGEIIASITKDTLSSSSFYILTLKGNVYRYSSDEGLKTFKTNYGQETLTGNILSARRHEDMINYTGGQLSLFGGYYSEAEQVEINASVPVSFVLGQVILKVPKTSIQYYWRGKALGVLTKNAGDTVNKVIRVNVNQIRDNKQDDTTLFVDCTIDMSENLNNDQVDFNDVTTVSEKTYLARPNGLKFTYEDKSSSGVERTVTLTPTLLSVCSNRLFVVNIDGYIYYSSVGVVDDFKEANGAGFFGGFYQDTSNTLSLDDYKDGVLITKRNGMYYLSLSTTDNVSSVSATSTSSLSITKIAEIGQEYASDHVIVGESVYAYDSNSQSIVLAAQQNVFGSIVAGKTLIPSEYLTSVNLGIANSRRFMTYNKESSVFILYYGEDLTDGIVLTQNGSLFPRKLDISMNSFIGLSQGVAGISTSGIIFQDFKKNTIIPSITPVAEFEPIALLGNKMTCASLLEVSELNAVEYNITVSNASTSYQHIKPYANYGVDGLELPPLLYSNAKYQYELFGVLPEEEQETLKELLMQKQVTKWARKKSNCTRIYAPMSGRDGISITFEFQANVAFCLAAITVVDFSQGE